MSIPNPDLTPKELERRLVRLEKLLEILQADIGALRKLCHKDDE